MKGVRQDLTGKVFGRWKVIEKAENGSSNETRWLCECQCEAKTIKTVRSSHLLSGNSKSCGCYQKEGNIERRTTHNKTYTRIYKIFAGMKQRCFNPNRDRYLEYGGRGITICDEWMNKENGFMNFYNWSMENGYTDELSIDRVNVDGNYEPSNCRWVSELEQHNNKQNSINITYNGETHTMKEWSKISNINIRTLYNRYWKGYIDNGTFLNPIRGKS